MKRFACNKNHADASANRTEAFSSCAFRSIHSILDAICEASIFVVSLRLVLVGIRLIVPDPYRRRKQPVLT